MALVLPLRRDDLTCWAGAICHLRYAVVTGGRWRSPGLYLVPRRFLKISAGQWLLGAGDQQLRANNHSLHHLPHQ